MCSFDVIMPGYLFCDVLFQGLEDLPKLGEEIYSEAMHITVGGAYNSLKTIHQLGLHAGLIADVGNDIFSKFILSEMQNSNIPTALIRQHERPMPTLTAILSFPHDRSFVTYMKEIDNIESFWDEKLQQCHFKHLHLPGLKEAYHSLGLITHARSQGIPITLDCQWHPDLMQRDDIWDILRKVDVFLPNSKEAMRLTGARSPEQALTYLQQKHVRMSAIKIGDRGSIGYDDNGAQYQVNALKVKVVDTTGAGDNFDAGFLVGYLQGLPFKHCMAYGNVCGSLSVTALGGSTLTLSAVELNTHAKGLL
jgi:sugar/nucleoside kinase (ribokinase family)